MAGVWIVLAKELNAKFRLGASGSHLGSYFSRLGSLILVRRCARTIPMLAQFLCQHNPYANCARNNSLLAQFLKPNVPAQFLWSYNSTISKVAGELYR
jgi:hypothetical protein